MLLANEFIKTQQEAVALAAEKKITYEEAVRLITKAKEDQHKRQRELERELINNIGNGVLDTIAYVKDLKEKYNNGMR